jgi:hypothetical protein
MTIKIDRPFLTAFLLSLGIMMANLIVTGAIYFANMYFFH